MTRPVSSSITSGIALPVTSPGYLVELDFTSTGPFRASSRGAITWNGLVFVPFGMQVSGLGADSTAAKSNGKIVFDDLNNALGTLILEQSFGGVPATVWAFYGDPSGGALGASDPTQIFAGQGGDCTFDINNGTVTMTLIDAAGPTIYLPRFYMTRENGFSQLPAPGTVINWGNGKIVLQAE